MKSNANLTHNSKKWNPIFCSKKRQRQYIEIHKKIILKIEHHQNGQSKQFLKYEKSYCTIEYKVRFFRAHVLTG